jgi:hypothetical protein
VIGDEDPARGRRVLHHPAHLVGTIDEPVELLAISAHAVNGFTFALTVSTTFTADEVKRAPTPVAATRGLSAHLSQFGPWPAGPGW